MEQFNFSNLKEAGCYARRGSNSAVLKRIEYYCHHPLLQDGNVLIDMPGIDAPVKKMRN
jgi:replication fork clamp-binding protein CrfC